MTYTGTPRTWAAGETATAALFNTDIRDPLLLLINPPRVSVSNSAAHSHTTSVSLLLTWDTEAYDSEGSTMHSVITNTGRLIAVQAGTYHVVARASFASNATGIRSLDVRKNAAGSSSGGTRIGYDSQTPVTGAVTSVAVICDVVLAANDYIEAFGFQSSGGALSTDVSAGLTVFQMRLVATT